MGTAITTTPTTTRWISIVQCHWRSRSNRFFVLLNFALNIPTFFTSIQKANLSPKNAFNSCKWMTHTQRDKKKKRQEEEIHIVAHRCNSVRFPTSHINVICSHRMGLNKKNYIKFSVPPWSDVCRITTVNPTDTHTHTSRITERRKDYIYIDDNIHGIPLK